jgi:isopentenyl diphosphate isomerase/L-lactate dehydrogenase-like FMN-dependent dehydrogenase
VWGGIPANKATHGWTPIGLSKTMIDPKLDRRFPSVADIETAAVRIMPNFIGEYISYGMGRGDCVRRNRAALSAVQLMPRYASTGGRITTHCEFLARHYDVPFGVAPVGLGGLAWPQAQESLARAARTHKLPFTTATFSMSSLETVRELSGDYAWFQLYRPNIPHVAEDMLRRAHVAGYDVLIVTVDVPAPSRRDHDLRNGFSIPPSFNFATALDILRHPKWGLAFAANSVRSGPVKFENVIRYADKTVDAQHSMRFISEMSMGHIDAQIFANLRAQWNGKLIVKGVLSADDALRYKDAGADAIIVSNHGGRQLEAAPATADMLPLVRAAVGDNYPLIVDGGVRSGLDICRMLALGADFVLLGRPFYYAIVAMGDVGASHIMSLLKAELTCTMGQLGCTSLSALRQRHIGATDSAPTSLRHER